MPTQKRRWKKVLILGGHHHLFFPSNHGGFMNELVWVCGEHANVVEFFFVGTLQWKDLQFATLEQT